MYRIRRCSSKSAKRIYQRTLPDDEWSHDEHIHWAVYFEHKVIGFASLKLIDKSRGGFLSASGVYPKHRGNNLQTRLIKTRINWAKRNGLRYLITYTTFKNYPSMVSLLKCGFKFYDPEWPWVGPDVHYYGLDINR